MLMVVLKLELRVFWMGKHPVPFPVWMAYEMARRYSHRPLRFP